MPDEQLLRKLVDRQPAFGAGAEREHRLVVLRAEPHALGRGLAEAQEAPQRIAECGELGIFDVAERLRVGGRLAGHGIEQRGRVAVYSTARSPDIPGAAPLVEHLAGATVARR